MQEVRVLNKINGKDTITINIKPYISQYAALEALTSSNSFLMKIMLFFKKKKLNIRFINKSKGLECNAPNGAFYIFPSCEKLIGLRTQEVKY